MVDQHRVPLDGGLVAEVRFTDAGDGDFRVVDPEPDLEWRRRSIVDRPWSWIRQVHGSNVLEVAEPGEHAGSEADGLITTAVGCPVAVTTADCAPVVLLAGSGLAVVHAGWRGLLAGIVELAGSRLRELGGPPRGTLLGPCIGPGAYRFGTAELEPIVGRFGQAVRSTTTDGEPALDLSAAVAKACEAVGWPAPEPPACTSGPRWFSHRTRAEQSRQTAVAWLTRDGRIDG